MKRNNTKPWRRSRNERRKKMRDNENKGNGIESIIIYWIYSFETTPVFNYISVGINLNFNTFNSMR